MGMRASASSRSCWYLRSSMGGRVSGTMSLPRERDAQVEPLSCAGGHELVGDGRRGGPSVLRVRVHADRLHRDAGLPLRQGPVDALADLMPRRDGVRLEEESPEPRAELRQHQPLALLGGEDDLNGLTHVALALGPLHAPIRTHAWGEAEAASNEFSGVHGLTPPWAWADRFSGRASTR